MGLLFGKIDNLGVEVPVDPTVEMLAAWNKAQAENPYFWCLNPEHKDGRQYEVGANVSVGWRTSTHDEDRVIYERYADPVAAQRDYRKRIDTYAYHAMLHAAHTLTTRCFTGPTD